MTAEERKLIQQLRDELEHNKPCAHPRTHSPSSPIDYVTCKDCGAKDYLGVAFTQRQNYVKTIDNIIAAADVCLAQTEPPVQPYEEWEAEILEMVTHISELHSRYNMYGTRGLHDAWTAKKNELRAHLSNHPAAVPDGFVLVPVESKRTSEQNYALMEAHGVTAADEFFSARSPIDFPQMRKIYDSAFQRAWSEAMIVATKAGKE